MDGSSAGYYYRGGIENKYIIIFDKSSYCLGNTTHEIMANCYAAS